MENDSISRQAAINEIDEWIKAFRENGHKESAADAFLIRDGIIQLPSAQPEDKCGECDAWNQYKNYPRPQWIPCSERLPEAQKKTYWICTDGGYQYECRWTNINHLWPNLTTDWHWHMVDVPQFSKVVAWMPLPEPYKGGKDEYGSVN